MVGTFVRLKVRLLRNRLRRSGPIAILAFAAVWLGATVLGLLAGLLSFVASRLGGGVLALIWCVLAFGWIVIPLLAAALDDTVEPTRLALLPIPNLRLATGLLAAAAVGPGALVTVLAAVGGIVGLARLGPGLVGQIAAGVTMVGWCLLSARLLTGVLSDLLRSRRGRDLAAVIGPLIGLLAVAVSQGLQSLTAESAEAGARFLEVLWVFPPGALARAAEAFRDGNLNAWLFLSYGILVSMLLLYLWGRSLARLVTKSPASSAPTRLRAGTLIRGLPRRLVALGWSSSPAAAVASKELRGLRRDPRLRSQFIGLGVALLVLATGIGQQLLGTEFAPLVAVAGAFIGVNFTGFNLFGMDSGSFWAYLAAGVGWRSVLIGKNVAILIVAGAVSGLLALAGLFLGGTVLTFLIALLASTAVALIWIAVGNNVSVLGAFALPESNLFGSRTLPGSAFLPSILGMMTAGSLTIPVLLVIALPWLWQGPAAALVGSLPAVAFAVMIYRLSLTMASGHLQWRSPQLLETLDGR
ncbi:MAG: hypothetical protein ACR2NT_12970 [Acidimicrobiia bacterium]